MNAGLPLAEPEALAAFVHLEERLRAARAVPELRFSIANETFGLFAYRQAFVWDLTDGTPSLATVSGLAQVVSASPFAQWLERLGRVLQAHEGLDGEHVTAEDLPDTVAADWAAWISCRTITRDTSSRLSVAAALAASSRPSVSDMVSV